MKIPVIASSPHYLILWIGGAMLAVHVAAMAFWPARPGHPIAGDAVHHFVQLRSLVYDRDLDFANEYTHLLLAENPEAVPPDWHELLSTPTGRVRNYMPVGPALLWAPGYLIGTAVLALGAAMGVTDAPDGFEFLLQLVPGITGVLVATAAAFLAWRMAIRWAAPAAATAGVMAAWLGSHALYYSLVAPSYSHAASMAAAALVLAHWIDRRDRWDARQAAVSGLLVGVASLMRWQDALWLAVPAIESLRSPGRWPQRAGRMAAMGLGWLVAFSPQMAVWQALYGSPVTMPQGGDFMRWTTPSLAAVVFHSKHGLFTWSPILVLAAAGLVTLLRRARPLALPLAFVVLASWYVNGAVADWWAGEAFGARRFLSLFPLFAIGLAVWLEPAVQTGRRAPGPEGPGLRRSEPRTFRSGVRWRLITVGFLVVANFLFLFQYQVFMRGWRTIAPYPDESWIDLWLMRFVIPFRVLARWLT